MSRFNPGFMRDLLLLGMMFIADRTQRQDIGLLRALPFIYTYQDLGLVPPYVKERQRLMRDGASIQKVLDDSHVLRLDRKPTSRQLRIEAMTQEKNLLLILPPGDIDIDRMRVLGPSDSKRRNIPPATAPEATWMWNDE